MRGGARAGAGRKKVERPVDGNLARKLKAQIKAEEKWLRIIEIETALLEQNKTEPLKRTLMYLDDRDLGKPVDTVNHVHDKPIEMNVTLSLAEAVQKARKRAAV